MHTFPSATQLSVEARPKKFNGYLILQFLVLILLGSVLLSYSSSLVYVFAGAVSLGLCWLVSIYVRRAGLELWQAIVLITLFGYLLLNYGFENLTIHIGGIPLILSYAAMFTALGLAVFSHWGIMQRALKEPAMLCILALLALAFVHLLVDLPSYGLWAIRDASMCLDGLFFLLGMLWATRKNCTGVLTKWLMVLFVVNLVYSFTMPWGEQLWSWSPQSGVFLHVPILGNYRNCALLLMTGALFVIYQSELAVTRSRRWILLGLAVAQLLGMAVTQARTTYIGLAGMFVVLVVIRENKNWTKLLVMFSLMLGALLWVTVAGIEIPGRIGKVDIAFLTQHLRSISGEAGTPGSTVESRVEFADEALDKLRTSPLLGVGFGEPLLSYVDDETGVVVRMPHNSSLSFLARMGIIGFSVFVAFHLCLTKGFLSAIWRRRYCDRHLWLLVLWLLSFYVQFMISSFAEGPFEFPSAAIPFYFFMGLAAGLIRWRMPVQPAASQPAVKSAA